MKIIKSCIFVVSSMIFTVSVNAETIESANLNAGASTTIAPTNDSTPDGLCSLLASSVRINLSANVEGTYTCDFANSDIRIGTCHIAGSRAEKTVSCTMVDDGDGGQELSDSNCTTAGTDATFTDRSAFIATSTGGSVSETALNGNTCSGDNLSGLSFFN